MSSYLPSFAVVTVEMLLSLLVKEFTDQVLLVLLDFLGVGEPCVDVEKDVSVSVWL